MDLLLVSLQICQCDDGFFDLEEVRGVEVGEGDDHVALEAFEAFLDGWVFESDRYALKSCFDFLF